MDISRAKEQIKNCVEIYLSKDEFGAYSMPVERQRPVFLLGAPGIGKTAVMEQIAQELDLPLVTYSMTHHTRQSALGLPVIRERSYQGRKMSVTDYTLSEIIVSIYETMERTGRREGILFLDEINCVSETLAPTMLQFLQYKTFGNHKIPEGWVIVTAGNPPKFNRSVREFDIVTLDRLKVMQIEPDYEAWSRYAKAKGVHHAVQGYLDLNKDDFYILETTKNGRQYVTARGWEDLADAIAMYEEKGLEVDESLAGQYLCHERICMQFIVYYRLYTKYKTDYGVRKILAGEMDDAVMRFKAAGLEERITVTRLITEAVVNRLKTTEEKYEGIRIIRDILKKNKGHHIPEEEILLHEHDNNGGKYLTAFYKELQKNIATCNKEITDETEEFSIAAELYENWAGKIKAETAVASEELENTFRFFEKAENGSEMLIFITELSINDKCSKFIFDHPSDGYMRNSSRLALGERRNELLKKLDELGD